jgi:hypothetical protein
MGYRNDLAHQQLASALGPAPAAKRDGDRFLPVAGKQMLPERRVLPAGHGEGDVAHIHRFVNSCASHSCARMNCVSTQSTPGCQGLTGER